LRARRDWAWEEEGERVRARILKRGGWEEWLRGERA